MHSKETVMSDASNTPNTGANTPHFDKLDDMERIFAPEQLPNNALPEHEIDADKGVDASTGAGDAAPLGGGAASDTNSSNG